MNRINQPLSIHPNMGAEEARNNVIKILSDYALLYEDPYGRSPCQTTSAKMQILFCEAMTAERYRSFSIESLRHLKNLPLTLNIENNIKLLNEFYEDCLSIK